MPKAYAYDMRAQRLPFLNTLEGAASLLASPRLTIVLAHTACAICVPSSWSYEAYPLCRNALEKLSDSSAAASSARTLALQVLS